MEENINKNVFLEELNKNFYKKLNITLSPKQGEQFFLFINFLIEENEKYNLTAIREEKQIIKKHFLDSCYVKLFFDKFNPKINKIIDIGTGAGFPGFPIAILYPEINFLLIDSSNKKISFINKLKEKTNVQNVTTLCSRAEELSHVSFYREKFDLVLSRAVAKINILQELSVGFLKKGGYMVFYKNIDIEEEFIDSKNIEKKLFIEKIDNIEYGLDKNEKERQIIIYKKLKETPNIYPRKYNQILSKKI